MSALVGPLAGPNRLKLGIFGTNSMGLAQTTVPEAHPRNWQASLDAVCRADRAGFEALVPYARWKGYLPDRADHPSHWALDTYTWAAAVAAVTRHAAVFATSHASTMHPVLAAKQAATIDHVSNGRFGLNVVGGWNKPELDMFGKEMGDHEDRYSQLEEWLALVTRLWTETEPITHHGPFFEAIEAISVPKPLQRQVPVMNAGGSERGRLFAAEHADLAFVILPSADPAAIRAAVRAYRQPAQDKFGRDLQVWTYAYVVHGATLEEANAYEQHYAVAHGDRDAAEAALSMQLDHGSLAALPPEMVVQIRNRLTAGGGGFRLAGPGDRICSQLEMLSECGIDGVLLSWVNYSAGLDRWETEVEPRLVATGLRRKAAES